MTDDLVKRLLLIGERVSIPCPDNRKGCLVYHFRIETDPTCKEAADRIEQLESALQRIADGAFSPQDDDVIWMDDDTPLGQFIDKELQRAELAGEKKND